MPRADETDERRQAATEILAAVLGGQPDAVRRILTEHIDNGQGSCRKCTADDPDGHDAHTWPCSTYSVAHATNADATAVRPPSDTE